MRTTQKLFCSRSLCSFILQIRSLSFCTEGGENDDNDEDESMVERLRAEVSGEEATDDDDDSKLDLDPNTRSTGDEDNMDENGSESISPSSSSSSSAAAPVRKEIWARVFFRLWFLVSST